MERQTVEIYEDRGERWAVRRQPVRRSDAVAFGERVPTGRLRVDLGCGAGRYTGDLGSPALALDAARTMLEQCRGTAPGVPLVRATSRPSPSGDRPCTGLGRT